MRWFEGGIAEAVAVTRKNGSIFVVYCEGNDTESQRFTNFLNTEKVSSQLSTDKFVCIKIQAESTSHHQFTEIYKKVNAPSIFFIGKGGVPLEIVESIKDADDILSRVERALQKSGVQFFNTIDLNSEFISTEQRKQVDESASARGGPSTSSLEREATPTQQEQVASDDAKKQEEIAKADRAAELSAKEKLEKAQQLIERTREAKKREEEEKERQRELERRKMGIEMQKQKRQKEDDEMKQLLEARSKEKKEQEAAKQRVLDQIQQDKADRASRFSSQNQLPVVSSAPQPPAQRTTPTSNVTRIQFKLPDGSAHTHEFPPATTLAEVRTYIRTNITLPFNQFLLATMFPRKEFNSEDDSKTLHDLELYPSAVLLILPISHGAVTTHTDGSFASMLWSWFAPLLNLLGYLKGMIFGTPRPPAGAAPPANGKRPAESGGPSSRPLPKRKPGETTAVKRQGNIHRLSDQRDSDEDNNTWNGNSTQQM